MPTDHPMPMPLDFLVSRDDLSKHVSVPGVVNDGTPLAHGQVLFGVDEFALTSNNITYAMLGDAMHYWRFFPAEPGWGRIPVWGFGRVLRSACSGIAEGQRFFGFFPMSTHVVLTPARRSAADFVDGALHRQSLNPAYNRYFAAEVDPFYEARREAEMMLLRPLFALSFLADDFFDYADFFGARHVVLSSASSKTAYGIAFLIARRRKVGVIGLTSQANRDFVAGLGCYDDVLSYHELERLPDQPVVYIDIAGNNELRRGVHRRCGAHLKYSCAIGLTHRGDLVGAGNGHSDPELVGPQPVFFFAPTQMKQRTSDWGAAGLQQRMVAAWHDFMDAIAGDGTPWLNIVHVYGQVAVGQVFDEMVAGRTQPAVGHVLSLGEQRPPSAH